jgi:hypothetical protein
MKTIVITNPTNPNRKTRNHNKIQQIGKSHEKQRT